MNIQYEYQTLANGLRTLFVPMHETKAVTILFLVGAGSRYEDARTNGVAHFLEHMFFKGTTKRPSTLLISKELDALGADYNAYTGEELTGFYVRTAASDFDQAFDIISDMLLDPLFQKEEIEREKGVIVEELNMYEDTPMRAIHDQAKRLMYGDTPLGRNIGGAREVVTAFDRDDFIKFRKKFYQPDNLIVAIAGAGDAKQWASAVEAQLGGLKGSAEKAFESAVLPARRPQVALGKKKTDQAHVMLMFPTFARTDERRPVLSVLLNILGGTMSSRLFIEVRERRGLAYYVSAGAWDFRDTGALVARAGIQVAKIDEAIKVILAEIDRFAAAPVSDEELERAKKNIRGGLFLGLEDSMSIADYLAYEVLFREQIRQPEEIIAKIEAVTREDVQSLAKEIFNREALNLTVIGPYESEARFEKLVR